MANLQSIRRRIASVRSTQKITRAMKMVAAAKLRRAQEAIMNARPYAYSMRDLTNTLLARADRENHPLMQPGTGDKITIIVVSSDRGLCGSFNSNLINETMRLVHREFAGQPVELIVLGRKAIDALRRRKCTIRSTYTGMADKSSVNTATRVVDEAVGAFTNGESKEIYCLYNEFKSAMSQKLTLERLLPYSPPEDSEASLRDYIFEPSEQEILFSLLVNNIHVQFYRILHESAASEQGARMAAMDLATQNAGDVIARLTLNYNRVRQDAITKEVVEVISAAEAV